MVGANYMGGKRNTARIKSKDVVGRAQRRHFGKQRLASALCVTQECRARPSARTSVLPEIALAHAHCESETGSSGKVFSGDWLYSSTPSSSVPQRGKPSKVLAALDISDHMSTRAAINRILLLPNLVGISIPKVDETAYIERLQTPVSVRKSTEPRLGFEVQQPIVIVDRSTHADLRVPGSRHSPIGPTHVDRPVSHPQAPEHEHTNTHEAGQNFIYKRAKNVVSPSDSRSGICDVISQNTFEEAKTSSCRRTDSLFRMEDDELNQPRHFLVHALPRSSPLPSSSQSSDDSILDIDFSPAARRSFALFEESIDCVEASPLRSFYPSTVRRPSRNYAARKASTSLGEAFTISLPTESDGGDIETELSHTTSCNDTYSFPLAENDDLRNIYRFDRGGYSVRVLTSQEATEDDEPGSTSIDFLSDPHPWETIGRILEFGPQPSAAQPPETLEICFTKDREGVGYVSLEESGRSLDATSFETMAGNKSTHDIRAASSVNTPKTEIADLEVPNAGDCVEVGIPDSLSAHNFTSLLFDTESASTRSEVDSHGHAHPCPEAPSIPVLIHCIQHESIRSPSSLTITVGATAVAANVDASFEGPSLFTESDLGEDD